MFNAASRLPHRGLRVIVFFNKKVTGALFDMKQTIYATTYMLSTGSLMAYDTTYMLSTGSLMAYATTYMLSTGSLMAYATTYCLLHLKRHNQEACPHGPGRMGAPPYFLTFLKSLYGTFSPSDHPPPRGLRTFRFVNVRTHRTMFNAASRLPVA